MGDETGAETISGGPDAAGDKGSEEAVLQTVVGAGEGGKVEAGGAEVSAEFEAASVGTVRDRGEYTRPASPVVQRPSEHMTPYPDGRQEFPPHHRPRFSS